MRSLTSVLSLLGAVSLLACAGERPPGPEIARTDQAIDLSGEWNDVDADLVAKELGAEILKAPWIDAWTVERKKKPVVRLYPVKNRTAGYIDHRYFTKQIEIALVQSGRVDVVSSLDEADDARTDRSDQAKHASDDTAKAGQQELGSDFIMNGSIQTQDDAGGGKEVRSYLTTLEIVDTATQRKAWAGQKKIKKLITR